MTSPTPEVHDWLEPVLDAARRERPLLVVCRTASTVRAVHRALAGDRARTAWADVQVTTIAGLVRQHAPRRLRSIAEPPGVAPLPEEHPWAATLAARPKLTRLLRRHVERAHACALAGRDTSSLRPELSSLVAAGWGRSDALAGAARLLGRAASYDAHEVIAIGFPRTLRFAASPFDRLVLSALGARLLEAGEPAPVKLEGWALPDVASEARAVAELACSVEGRVLVLTADTATQERIRAALRRNAIAVADDGAAPLRRHALAALLDPLLSVFASRGMEPVHASVLALVLTSPVLSSRPPASGVEPVPGVDRLRSSARQTRGLLVRWGAARRRLGEWADQLGVAEAEALRRFAEADEELRGTRARELGAARVTAARVRALARHAGGAGTLGDLAAAVRDLGLADPGGDRLGRAILHALAEEGHQPCDEAALEEALSGALGSGRVDRGVELLTYDAYDGRDAQLLVLTGVHDHGVARPPAPDPLLTAADRDVLGLPSPREAVEARIASARWAATRAVRTVALCTERDESGRAVTPPVELELAMDESRLGDSYGLDLALPETADRAALAEGAGTVDRFTTQVDVEWAREGTAFAAVEPTASFDADSEPLGTYLARFTDRYPEDLRPWLGFVGTLPGASDGLPPDLVLSASRLGDFMQCTYRAFARTVLRLEPREEMADDFAAADVGKAVHAALEHAVEGVRWVVPDDEVAAARADLLRALDRGMREALDAAAKRLWGAIESDTQRAARAFLAARWQRHFAHYVRARIIGVSAAHHALCKERFSGLRGTPELEAALDAIGPEMRKTPRRELEGALLDALVDCGGEEAGLARSGERIAGLMSARKNAERVREVFRSPLPEAVRALCTAARSRIAHLRFAPSGDLRVVRPELEFGRSSRTDSKPALRLALGRATLEVRGRMDSVERRIGEQTDVLARYRITDFKTGKSRPGRVHQMVQSLVRPQLVFYALALEELGSIEDGAPVHPTEIAYDWVRKLEQIDAWIDDAVLAHARTAFGEVIDAARDGTYAVLPHPDGCPIRGARGAYCDFQGLCRLRATFAPEEERMARREGDGA